MTAEGTRIDVGSTGFEEINEKIRETFERTDSIELDGVLAQRYLGCAMPDGKHLEIHGVPGNDMACYMDGGSIEVFGNAQDQIGNTMNNGSIIVHGRCGDAAGYAMRGGQIFVRDGCGWRVGIHMKQYENRCPMIVIGGDAGSFLGEYMAGGLVVLLGKPGEYLATGMHGGIIYLRHKLAEDEIMPGLVLEPVDETDRKALSPILQNYNDLFAKETASIDATGEGFWKLRPASSRPYVSMYAS